MYLGTRKIRSAGRSSGSIEVTLPAQIQDLEGIECFLSIRDGPNPEIVLQPVLAEARTLFSELWQKLCLCLEAIDDPGTFAPADFTLALFPPRHWQERPPLAYIDALIVLRQRAGQKLPSLDALNRLLTFLAVAIGHRLGLQGSLALAFGDAVAYLITDISVGLGTDFERGMAHRTFCGKERMITAQNWSLCHAVQQPMPPDAWQDGKYSQIWQQAQPGFSRVYEQFRTWQDVPARYASDREKWYRALAVEMGMRIASVEEHIAQQ